jgi:hypothetical protein
MPLSSASGWRQDLWTTLYYVNITLQPFLEGRSSGPGAGLIIHADNGRPHTARRTLEFFRENHLGIAPHPPYSPDLMPSDHFLFEHIKRALEGVEFRSEKALLVAIQSVLSQLTAYILSTVFAKWVERPNWVALNEEHCYRYPKQ